mmetsp:Transcript_20307/g.81887  ORF Transcript_20307/g.81887 Transcript_20307/m.81887 type:complete len:200 (+) Transcript_20307:521-1120(+)
MKLTHLTSYNTLFGPPYQVCLILPPTTSNLHATAALEGIFLGAYKDNRWRTEKKAPSRCAESVYLSSQVKLDIASIRCVCEGIIFTRQLVNAPPNVLKPAVLAQCMTECADRYGMDIKILEREDCEGLGMGLYLGVAQVLFFHVHLRHCPMTEKQCNFTNAPSRISGSHQRSKVHPCEVQSAEQTCQICSASGQRNMFR